MLSIQNRQFKFMKKLNWSIIIVLCGIIVSSHSLFGADGPNRSPKGKEKEENCILELGMPAIDLDNLDIIGLERPASVEDVQCVFSDKSATEYKKVLRVASYISSFLVKKYDLQLKGFGDHKILQEFIFEDVCDSLLEDGQSVGSVSWKIVSDIIAVVYELSYEQFYALNQEIYDAIVYEQSRVYSNDADEYEKVTENSDLVKSIISLIEDPVCEFPDLLEEEQQQPKQKQQPKPKQKKKQQPKQEEKSSTVLRLSGIITCHNTSTKFRAGVLNSLKEVKVTANDKRNALKQEEENLARDLILIGEKNINEKGKKELVERILHSRLKQVTTRVKHKLTQSEALGKELEIRNELKAQVSKRCCDLIDLFDGLFNRVVLERTCVVDNDGENSESLAKKFLSKYEKLNSLVSSNEQILGEKLCSEAKSTIMNCIVGKVEANGSAYHMANVYRVIELFNELLQQQPRLEELYIEELANVIRDIIETIQSKLEELKKTAIDNHIKGLKKAIHLCKFRVTRGVLETVRSAINSPYGLYHVFPHTIMTRLLHNDNMNLCATKQQYVCNSENCNSGNYCVYSCGVVSVYGNYLLERSYREEVLQEIGNVVRTSQGHDLSIPPNMICVKFAKNYANKNEPWYVLIPRKHHNNDCSGFHFRENCYDLYRIDRVFELDALVVDGKGNLVKSLFRGCDSKVTLAVTAAYQEDVIFHIGLKTKGLIGARAPEPLSKDQKEAVVTATRDKDQNPSLDNASEIIGNLIPCWNRNIDERLMKHIYMIPAVNVAA